MQFDCKKTENCFEHSFTFEYRLPVTAQELSKRLEAWTVTENHSYRRAIVTAERDGVKLKGILKANVVSVSFPEKSCETDKTAFEDWLLKEKQNE